MNMNETFDTTTPVEESAWYVDVTEQEYAEYCVWLSRLRGAMRHRTLLMVVAMIVSAVLLVLAVGDWYFYQMPFDWISAVCGVLMWIPIGIWAYMPRHIRKKALDHHKASIAAGMVFNGRLTITPDYIEKAGPSATAHIRLDAHTNFVETRDMMVFMTMGSPALILPGRCLTPEMAAAVRRAADRLPVRNRRFIARIHCGGEIVAPVELQKPIPLWTSTFTYTAEEFTVVARSSVWRRFWRIAPWVTLAVTLGALMFGWWEGGSMQSALGYFLMLMGIVLVINLVMPLMRIAGSVRSMSAHDLTMKLTFDTVALRMEAPKGGNNWVLWRDVTHVYDKGDFAEVVIEKNASLYIPKRAIEDIPAFELALEQCRGKK